MSTLKRVLALSLALMLALSLAVFAHDFDDSNEIDPATAEAIDMLVALQILHKDGYGDGTFRPNETITRAQAAKMIYVMMNRGVDDNATLYAGPNTFHDVTANDWFVGYVEYCYALGILAGRGNNATSGKPVLDPYAPITGNELAKMLLCAANYNPVVEGFTGDNWAQNVLKHARNSGLIEDYAALMSAAAPRQWAALMMSNLITRVYYATYLGDSLVTGSLLEQSYNTLVGVKLMGLAILEGTLTQTKTANLGGGWDEDGYDYAEVEYTTVSTVNNVTTYGTDTANIDYSIPNSLLGRTVRVIMQRVNPNVTSISPTNVKVLSVYPMSKNVETQTTMDKIKVSASDKFSDTGYEWQTGDKADGTLDTLVISVGNAEYTFKFDFNATGTADYESVAKKLNDLMDTFITNDYSGNPVPCDIDNSSSALEVQTFIKKVQAYFGDRKDDVVLLNNDGSGAKAEEHEFYFITETTYARVSSINNTRISLSGGSVQGSFLLTDINFEGDTPERNDIVAISKNYASGELVYDVRTIEPMTATASAWTASTLTLDGTKYGLANQALTGTAINQNHKTFYIDKGYIVYSTDGTSSDGTAPDDLVIVTGVGVPYMDNMGRITISVTYRNAAGTQTEKKYDFTASSSAIAYDKAPTATGQTGAGTGYEILAKYTNTGFDKDHHTTASPILRGANETFVQVVETSNGVYFKEITSKDTYAELTINKNLTATANLDDSKTTQIEFDAPNMMFQTKDGTREVSVNAKVYAWYSSKNATTNIYTRASKVLNAADLGDFDEGDGVRLYGMVYDQNGVIVALSLDFGYEPIPTITSARTFLVITSASESTKDGIFATVKLANGESTQIKISKIAGDTATLANVNRYTGRMMEYTVSSGAYTLTKADADVSEHNFFNETQINEAGDKSFKAGGQIFNYDSNTVFFFIEDGVVTVANEPFFGAEKSTAIVTKDVSNSLVDTAIAVIVNGDGDNVNTNNIQPKADTAKPTITKAELDVTGKIITLTFSQVVSGTNGFTVFNGGSWISKNTAPSGDPVYAPAYTVANVMDAGKHTNKITITLDVAVLSTAVLTIDYASSGNVTGANDYPMAAFADLKVTNGANKEFAIAQPEDDFTIDKSNLYIGETITLTGVPADATIAWTGVVPANVTRTGTTVTYDTVALGPITAKVTMDGYNDSPTYTWVVKYVNDIDAVVTQVVITNLVPKVGDTLTATVTAVGGFSAYTIEWTVAGNPATAESDGTYKVKATDIGKVIAVKVSAAGYYDHVEGNAPTAAVAQITGAFAGYEADTTAQDLTVGAFAVAVKEIASADPLAGTVTIAWSIDTAAPGSSQVIAAATGLTCTAANIAAMSPPWTLFQTGDVVTCTITSSSYATAQVITFTVA